MIGRTRTRLLGWAFVIVCSLSGVSLGVLAFSPTASDAVEALLDDVEMGSPVSNSMRRSEAAVDTELAQRFKREYLEARYETRPVFEKYLSIVGPQRVLDLLEEMFPACHGQAHPLGRAIFARVQDMGAALKACNTRCTSGCMHGVVVEAFDGIPFASITAQMTRFCAQGEMVELHKPGNCAHGIGHALMMVTGNDVQQALGACTAFSDPAMGYYCATGVFMEYLITGKKAGKMMCAARVQTTPATIPVTEPPQVNSFHHPCDTYTQYPAACYRYRVKQMLRELKGKGSLVVKECLALPPRLRLGCFHGLGAGYSRAILEDPPMIAQVCEYGTPEDQAMCIEGAIEKLADFNEHNAMAACATLNGDNALICRAAAKGKMYRLNKPTMALYHGR